MLSDDGVMFLANEYVSATSNMYNNIHKIKYWISKFHDGMFCMKDEMQQFSNEA